MVTGVSLLCQLNRMKLWRECVSVYDIVDFRYMFENFTIVDNGDNNNNANMFSKNKGIVVGVGVGITRDCTIIMIAQYFKKKREFVEALSVAGSGLGICVMSTFLRKSVDALGWR